MEPFSIATGVVGLAQGLLELVKLAGELRDSVEKVSKNRKKTKQLSADTLYTVEIIQEFYTKYSEAFAEAQDLRTLVSDLRISLEEIVKSCNEMLPGPKKGTFRKGMAGLRAWLKRDELETRLTELNSRAQKCQLKFMTLATLSVNVTAHEIRATAVRIETSVSSIHQCVAVRKATKDVPECPQIRHSPLSLVKIPISPHLELSDNIVKHAFLRLQVNDISKLLSNILQNPHTSFHIPSLDSEDLDNPFASCLYTDWEAVQRWTAFEAIELIDTIQNSNPPTAIVQIGTMLTYLSGRYEHLGMHHEALVLSSLAIQSDRLAIQSRPDSNRFQQGLAIDLQNYATRLRLSEGSTAVEATQCMVEAVAIFRKLAAEHPLPERRVKLANCLSLSSWLSRSTGDLKTAELHSAEAINIILEVMGAHPAAIADANSLELAHWAGVEIDGVLVVDEWQDQAILVYAGVLKQRFHCALSRQSFPEAYKYASASRSVYQTISNHHPQSHLSALLDITIELLEDWANPLRSSADTVTLYTDVIGYISAIPSWEGELDGDTLFKKYALHAEMSVLLHKASDLSGALETQRMASMYWDRYYSAHSKAPQPRWNLSRLVNSAFTFFQQVWLHRAARPQPLSPLLDFGRSLVARTSGTRPFAVLGQTEQPIHQQARTMERWIQDAHAANLSPERVDGARDEDMLSYCALDAVIARCFACLGDSDAVHQATRRAIDTSSRIIASHPSPSGCSGEGWGTWWQVVRRGLGVAMWVSDGYIEFANDFRSLPWIQEATGLAKSLFPAEEPICIPSDASAEAVLDNIGAILAFQCRQLEILRRMDESLSVCRSNLDWYAPRWPPSTYPIYCDYRYIGFVLDLVRNLIYAGRWTNALTRTTPILETIISSPASLSSPTRMTTAWWTLALLTHCSILTELGRVEAAAEYVTRGIEALTRADIYGQQMWKGPTSVRKAIITTSLRKELAGDSEMRSLGNYDMPDLLAYTRNPAYYFRVPGQIYSGFYLDASCICADSRRHREAITYAQDALSSIGILTTHSFNWWQDVALTQQRTDSGIALAVAFVLGGHIQDAADLFPHIFAIYKKDLQHQRNLYPGYAVALRLAAWVFDAVGNISEGQRMRDREAGLRYRLDGEEDEETLRVVRVRLEMEENRPAIRRVRHILGVEPYRVGCRGTTRGTN